MPERLTVLITGATAGIGRVTALHLAGLGLRIIAAGRRTGALEEMQKEARDSGLGTVTLDVTKPDSVSAAKAAVDEMTGGYGIDVLVNNAGYAQAGPLELLSDEALKRQFETNVFGLLAVTRAFLPPMRQRRRGRIINVSSVAGRIVVPFLAAYDATKFTVEGLSDGLRRELRLFGIQVVVIQPGAIRTEFGEKEREGLTEFCKSGSPYRAFLEPFIAWHRKLHPSAPEPRVVARAIERAVTARRPSCRYVVPATNRGLLLLNAILPSSWTDRLIARATGIGRAG